VLHLACMQDDPILVQLVIAGSADIEAKNADNFTALQFAAATGLSKAVRALIPLGADVTSMDHRWRTPFLLAAQGGYGDAVMGFIDPVVPLAPLPYTEDVGKKKKSPSPGRPESGEDKALASPRGKKKSKSPPGSPRGSPRDEAPRKKLTSGVAAKKGVEKEPKSKTRGDTPFHLFEVAGEKRLKVISAKEATQQPVGPKLTVKQADCDERNALAIAIRRGLKDMVRVLVTLKNPPDVEATDKDGTSILVHAVFTKSTQIVLSVLEAKARVDRKNSEGKAALDLCTDTAVRSLLENFLISESMAAANKPAKKPATAPSKTASKGKAKQRAPSKERVASKESAVAPEEDIVEADPVEVKPEMFTVRFENLPICLTGELLEEHIKSFLWRIPAPNPEQLVIALDPITSHPRGWAHGSYKHAAAAELALRGNGEELLGQILRITLEVPPIGAARAQTAA